MLRLALVGLIVGIVGCVPPYGTQQQWQTVSWDQTSSDDEAYPQPQSYPRQLERDAQKMEREAREMERLARQQRGYAQASYPQQSYPQQRYPQATRTNARNSGRQWMCKAESKVSSPSDDGVWRDNVQSALGGGPSRDIAYLNALKNCIALVKTEDSLATIGGNYRSSGLCKVVECM
jgi:hypothetical protein